MRVPRVIRRQYQDIRNYNEFPRYFIVVQVAAGVALFLGLGYMLMKPDNSAHDQKVSQAWSRAQAQAGTSSQTTPGGGDRSTNPGSSSGGATVSVARSDGSGSVTVPLSTVDTAKAATKALFTGDFSAVMFAPGVSTPAAQAHRWPSPQIAEPTVESATPTRVAFAITVDPDGSAGPESPRALVTSVVNTDGTWGYGG